MDTIKENDTEQIKELKRQIIRLQDQLARQKEILQQARGGNLLQSEPIDFYPGEQLDFVLSILRQVQPRCPEGSRSRDILDSLIRLNKPVGEGEQILGKVQKIFKRGNPTTEADILELKSLGFTYTPSRKHPKLRFHDKYMFVVPNSPSDNRRGAKNMLSEINKCIAVSQKV